MASKRTNVSIIYTTAILCNHICTP